MSRAVAMLVRVAELGSVPRSRQPALLLVLVVATSLPLLAAADVPVELPVAWPAVALLTALLLVSDTARRGSHFVTGAVLLAGCHLLVGVDPVAALGAALATAAGAWVTWWRLRRGLDGRDGGLVEEGDVSRLIASASAGATVAAAATALLALLTQAGTPWLAAVAVLGTHSAAHLMLLPLFLGILQVGLVLHVRNTLTSAASEGARYAARVDRALEDGRARTREQVASALTGSLAPRVSARDTTVRGQPGVEVRVEADVPALGLWGPAVHLDVTGHAVKETLP